MYGHDQPQLFYTDNISDRLFLENSFPSLRKDVLIVDKYADLDPFEVTAAGISIFPKDTPQSINDAVSTILDDIPTDGGNIAIGFDTEWNVEISPQGYVVQSGKTAVVQIAYQDRVYVLQVRY